MTNIVIEGEAGALLHAEGPAVFDLDGGGGLENDHLFQTRTLFPVLTRFLSQRFTFTQSQTDQSHQQTN